MSSQQSTQDAIHAIPALTLALDSGEPLGSILPILADALEESGKSRRLARGLRAVVHLKSVPCRVGGHPDNKSYYWREGTSTNACLDLELFQRLRKGLPDHVGVRGQPCNIMIYPSRSLAVFALADALTRQE